MRQRSPALPESRPKTPYKVDLEFLFFPCLLYREHITEATAFVLIVFPDLRQNILEN